MYYITNYFMVFKIGEYFNLINQSGRKILPLVLFLSLLVVPYSSDLLLLDFFDDEFFG